MISISSRFYHWPASAFRETDQLNPPLGYPRTLLVSSRKLLALVGALTFEWCIRSSVRRCLQTIGKCRSDNSARLALVKPGLRARIQLTAVVCCRVYSWLNWWVGRGHPPSHRVSRALFTIYTLRVPVANVGCRYVLNQQEP